MIEGCVKQLSLCISLLLLLFTFFLVAVMPPNMDMLTGDERPHHVQLPTAGRSTASTVSAVAERTVSF